MNNTKLVWITPDAENIISYCARVSSPQNQENYSTAAGLLSYCIKNKHWSIFEQANMCVEITTGRDISAQILRHRSFSFQEFSQRYAEVSEYVEREARRQDVKNRQNSIDDLSDEVRDWWRVAQAAHWINAKSLYKSALDKGIAKECARSILPMQSKTRLYMNGTIRSWIHYLELRCGNGTQKEHMDIANEIKDIFVENLPTIGEALKWK